MLASFGCRKQIRRDERPENVQRKLRATEGSTGFIYVAMLDPEMHTTFLMQSQWHAEPFYKAAVLLFWYK